VGLSEKENKMGRSYKIIREIPVHKASEGVKAVCQYPSLTDENGIGYYTLDIRELRELTAWNANKKYGYELVPYKIWTCGNKFILSKKEAKRTRGICFRSIKELITAFFNGYRPECFYDFEMMKPMP